VSRARISITGFSLPRPTPGSNTPAGSWCFDPWDERDRAGLQEEILAELQSGFAQIEEAVMIASSPRRRLPGVGTASGFTLQLQDKAAWASYHARADHRGDDRRATPEETVTALFTTFRAGVPQLFVDIDREQVKTNGHPAAAPSSTRCRRTSARPT
jgi:multidrug efflux pump subunit AcrB